MAKSTKEQLTKNSWKEKLQSPGMVRRSFGEKAFILGKELFEGGMVGGVDITGLTAKAWVRTGKKPVETRWEITATGRLKLECSCRQFAYCAHQIALYLALYYGINGNAPDGIKPPKRISFSASSRSRQVVHIDETYPYSQLSVEDRKIRLEAFLKSKDSDREWNVGSHVVAQHTGEHFVACKQEEMREFFREITSVGFVQSGPGSFWLDSPWQIEDFLLETLPEWQSEYTVELDEQLQSVTSEEDILVSRSRLEKGEDGESIEVDWSLEGAGVSLSPAELTRLKKCDTAFFWTDSGKLIRIQPGHLTRQLQSLDEIGYSTKKGGRQNVPLHFLARAVDHLRNGQSYAEISKELEDLYDKLNSFEGIEEVDPPAELSDVLRSYQRKGLDFLNFLSEFRFGGILADDMGLGKTLQALALLEIKRREAKEREPSLVVCPTSVAGNWLEEVKKFTPEMKAIHLRSSAEIANCDFKDYDLIVISYGLMRRNEFEQTFRYLILDEAQNIKNPKTKIARAVKQVPSRYRLALTGTPIENGVMELWSIFDFLMPGFLGTYSYFKRHYEREIMSWGSERRLRKLHQTIKPFFIRRLKSEVAKDLPPKTEQNIFCDMLPKQEKLYHEFRENVRSELSKKIDSEGWKKSQIWILAALTRLRQICCHPALWEDNLESLGSGKLEAFIETLDSILSGEHRVVVFSQFVQMMKLVEKELVKSGVDYLYLDGSTTNRTELIEKFQNDDKYKVFLMSLKAGGTGVNLTAADYVILFDPWWNPAVENQAIDRTHRIGQDKPVTAYRLLTQHTIEDRMEELKAQKKELADQLISSDTQAFKKLTREDLEFLLS